jgi:twitching motility protein PilT
LQSIETFLAKCVEMGGSDLHFKTDTGRAYVRVNGDLMGLDAAPYTDAEFRTALYHVLKINQIAKFERDLELDFALEVVGLSRFRGNAYQQRGHMQAAFRVIPYDIQSMEDLSLPKACYDFIDRPRGLVLVTGPAGSGKSTTLAAMLDRINRSQPLHIVTVEDPVEFVHEDHKALINQRELDVDTNSFAHALKYVLRQDPDVILVGEMRPGDDSSRDHGGGDRPPRIRYFAHGGCDTDGRPNRGRVSATRAAAGSHATVRESRGSSVPDAGPAQ